MKKYIWIPIILILLIAGYLLLVRPLSASTFSTSTRGLQSATETRIVSLRDGDSYDLTASYVKKNINGREVRMLAYNGSIPGPTIRVAQGSTVTINFKNDTDIANTLHSHGVRMDNAFDGVPDVTQKAVQPGESFAYKLTFPDSGAYWYHPHVRDDYTIELGLYGNFLVTPTVGSSWNSVDREIPIFLDDILMDENGIVPFQKETATHTLMGRFGNVMLTNGQTDYVLNAKRNEVLRLYFTNSANARPFNVVIPGARMKLVGGDSGLYERDSWVSSIIITPSERAIMEVTFTDPGEYSIQNQTPGTTTTLGKIVVSDDAVTAGSSTTFDALYNHTEVTDSIKPFQSAIDGAVDKNLKLSILMMGKMHNMGGSHMMGSGSNMQGGMGSELPADGIEWIDTSMSTMNTMSDTNEIIWNIIDPDTNKQNMNIDWSFKSGDQPKIRITNDANSMHPMQHPIHFHGQRFLVVNRNGIPQTNLAWKDTLLVPAGQYIDIVLDASNPGTWMAHCHILEHIEAGMMFSFKVI